MLKRFFSDHIAGLSARVESGKWVMGGKLPMVKTRRRLVTAAAATVEKPPVGDEPRSFNGSFMVAHGATKEEVLEEVKRDVYAQRGIWDVDKVRSATSTQVKRAVLTVMYASRRKYIL